MHCTSFPFAACADARVLILGSMPGIASLQQQQYYAHPRNCFWDIIERLFAIERALPYAQRLARLNAQGIALWDVLQHCDREGSLDTAIDRDTIEANDFRRFFRDHRRIERIFFNGKKASDLYRRYVLPQLDRRCAALPRERLPSTSPAHAALNFAAKLAQWQRVSDGLQK